MKETEQLFFEENNIMFNSFLEEYFYKDFKKENSNKVLELIIFPYCDLSCKYCYVDKYYNQIYTNFEINKVKENLKKILEWYVNNNFKCSLDIFSGEIFASNFGIEILEYIIDFFKDKKNKPKSIVIPTNYSFILNDDKIARIEKILDKANSIGIKIYLSASVDGKYMDENRPFKNGYQRTDEYYDKIFKFNNKHKFMFHPMIYSDGIENWKKNFEWFQSKFIEFGNRWNDIYLLQVRNNNWTEKSNKELYNFISFLFDFCFEKFECDSNKFYDFIVKDGLNILNEGIFENSNGVPCSIQSSLPIRISDLKMFPCHRMIYPELEIGGFNQQMEFSTKNAELGTVIYSQNNKAWPICSRCPIKEICIKGCLGMQYEEYHDMFIPCKSVCQQFFYYYKALIDGYCKSRIYKKILSARPELEPTFKFLKEMKI